MKTQVSCFGTLRMAGSSWPVLSRTVMWIDQDPLPRCSGPQQAQCRSKNPYTAWHGVVKKNPEDTGVLVCGGASMTRSPRGLTFLDLGSTPVYATSTWQILSDYLEKPKKQHTLPTPPNTEVVDFCLIPRSSPHFAGTHDPIAVIALLTSGEIVTLSFPSGHPITPTNQLHVSLSFVHPYVNRIAIASIDRTRWLGMTENRSHGPPMLRGGAEATHPLKRYESRNILQTAHVDGTIRLWDAGHGDEVENEDMLQVDVARAVGRFENVDITKTSMSGITGELAVGVDSGELVVFRWDHNRNFGREVPHRHAEGFGLETIKDRADPAVKEGLLPLTMLNQQEGSVSALQMSDVGFIGVGFEGGSFAVIDLRGPALIYNANLSDFSKQSKRGSIRRSGGQSQTRAEWPTVIEFGVMSLEGEGERKKVYFLGCAIRLTGHRLFEHLGLRWNESGAPHHLQAASRIAWWLCCPPCRYLFTR